MHGVGGGCCRAGGAAHPAFLDASGTELMPTSMTVAPGLSHSPLTKPALPIAATTMSACSRRAAGGWLRAAWPASGRGRAHLAHDCRDVGGARVAHRHRRVLGEEEVGDRDANDVRPANDDGPLAVDGNAVAL